MANNDMTNLLNLELQETKSPLIRWIKDRLQTGKGTDYGELFHEVVDLISLRVFQTLTPVYLIDCEDGLFLGLPPDLEKFLSDWKRPKEHELDAFAMVHPDTYSDFGKLCEHFKLCLDKPHSCDINYHIDKAYCQGIGCGRKGHVNYRVGEYEWRYYCGGSPNCCP